jgi:hypothetical protein
MIASEVVLSAVSVVAVVDSYVYSAADVAAVDRPSRVLVDLVLTVVVMFGFSNAPKTLSQISSWLYVN